MIARCLVVLTLIFTIAAPALAQSPSPARRISGTVPAPDDRARQWLVLVDDKNYAQSWTEAGAAFKAKQRADAWAADAGNRRGPLGAVASRGLKSIDLSRNNTAVIRYDTVFARKAAAVETVTLNFENGGWAVVDYSVN
jgi:hypothetical protein